MSHKEHFLIDGIESPSVTDVLSVVDKPGLYSWFAKHGVLKAHCLADYFVSGSNNNKVVELIPNSWFNDNNIKREDFWKTPEEIGREAGERGNLFHSAVALHLKGLDVPEDQKEAISIVDKWCNLNTFYFKEAEKHVVSKDYLYHGTFDVCGTFDNGLEIVDWKKTNYISDTYVLQLSAYAQAYLEQEGDVISKGRIVRLYELEKQAKEDKVDKQKYGLKYSFKGSKYFIEERQYDSIEQYFPVFMACKQLYDFLKRKGKWTPQNKH